MLLSGNFKEILAMTVFTGNCLTPAGRSIRRLTGTAGVKTLKGIQLDTAY